MLDLLEVIVEKRDYKLKFVWGCTEIVQGENCQRPISLLIDRTPEEVSEGKRNIKQKCFDGHVTRPHKKCTKCGAIYEMEQLDCNNCEGRVRNLAQAEVEKVTAEKRIIKIKKQLKKGELDEKNFNEQRNTLEQIIKISEAILKELA